MAVSKSAFARAFQRGNEQGMGLLMSEFQRKQALARQDQMLKIEQEEARRKERNQYLREQEKQRFEYREGERDRANRLAIAKLQEEGATKRTRVTQRGIDKRQSNVDEEKRRKMQFDTWVLNNIGVPLEEIKNEEKSIQNTYYDKYEGGLAPYGRVAISSLLNKQMKLVNKNRIASNLYAQGLGIDEIEKYFADEEKKENEAEAKVRQYIDRPGRQGFPFEKPGFQVSKNDNIFSPFGGGTVK